MNNNQKEELDQHSPYIKNNVHGISEFRKSFSTDKIKSGFIQNQNLLDLKRELAEKTSDGFLEKRIRKVCKKIVGDEIQKFSQILSEEISKEFNELENRLQNEQQKIIQNTEKEISYLEQDFNDKLAKQNSLIKKMEFTFEEKLNSLLSLIHTKIQELENKILELKNHQYFTDENQEILIVSKNDLEDENFLKEEENNYEFSLQKDKNINKEININEEEEIKEIINKTLSEYEKEIESLYENKKENKKKSILNFFDF